MTVGRRMERIIVRWCRELEHSETNMKNKLIGIIGIALLALAATAATTLEWTASDPGDNVTSYWLEHRPTTSDTWTRVEVLAPNNRVTIPESAFGRWFRIAAVNSFGASDWTEPVKLPEKISGLKLVMEFTP